MITQISQQDIDRSSTLEQSDLDKWCFVLDGCYSGFKDTAEEAKELMALVTEQDQRG